MTPQTTIKSMGIIRMSAGVIIGAVVVMACLSSSVGAGIFVMSGGDDSDKTPAPAPAPAPAPVDCVYTESDEFTPCASIYWSLPASRRLNSGIPACGSGAGEQYKRINVVTEPKHGGAACPLRGETRTCDIECEDCRGEFKPVVKGGYSNAWFNYKRKWATTRYDVTSPAGVGGAACPYRDGQKISKILKNASGVNYDYGTDCGKYVGQGGDSTKDDVFGTKLVSNHEDIQNFDATVESYHKVQDKVWCAVHK